ncbi:Ig-like domain repeat protein, partial [Methanobrevibacter sp.]|uniref:Ig-like domain repeat protein n=1 Tax=Methanobrevibacter sp. TaxID=66852 RepID=UPI0026E0C033
IFHMYGNFSLVYSTFENNSANNGGALFIDNSTNAIFMRNTFTNNKAANTGGAIYSLLNKLNAPFQRFNSANSNVAAHEKDYYDVSALDLVIGNGNYTMYNVDENSISSLPSRYCLIDEGYVTGVNDQQTSGNCWAFTAIAVLESCILKASGNWVDLSEENMKNVIALYSDYGWNLVDTNNGGYDNMPWGYLASWLGPVNEIDDTFDDKSTLSPILNSVMHVQNIKFLERRSYTDNDEIKKAILNYGAVGTGIYQDPYYLNSNTHAYYCWYNTYCNHAVTIVGWDDNFSKDNFRWGSDIEGNGAWIVKNSWGDDWEDNGYYYVSYYDANFARPLDENCAYTIILNDTIRFDKNYQYDIAGMTDYFLNSSSKVWYKNVFISTSDEYLAAVSTYFEKVCNWTASVLINGELEDVLSGSTTPGYYTFNLNKYIQLKPGDIFEIIFNITSFGEASFPISEATLLNTLVYSPQISYLSYDGENWVDLYNLTWRYSTHNYSSQVACIKAFTYINPINTLTNLSIDFKQDELSNVTAIVIDEYGNLVKCGKVSFNINGENQSVNVVNGKAILSYDLNKKINSISAVFDGEGYNSSSNMTSYVLPKINIDWTLNITQVYNNVNITVSANKLLNESIIMIINGEKVPFELINGSNTLELKNLANDLYGVHVSLLDNSYYSADILSDEFVIELYNTRIVSNSLNATDEGVFAYNITLFDENNNSIANKKIIFTIGNVNYMNVTDDNGIAIIFIKLEKGVYDVKSTFEGDNNYFASNESSIINVKGKIFINLDMNTFRNIAFINVYATNNINETFMLLINNKTYNITSKNGLASLKLYNLSNGIYDVTVFMDEDEYEFNEINSQFVIDMDDLPEINTNIVMSDADVTVNIDAGNAEGSVVVIIDGAYAIVNLDKGRANYTIKDIAPGNHSIIIYDGLSSYFKSEVFTIPKKESSIELVVNNTKVGEKSTILVEVTPEATGIVSIDINGTDYLINLSKTNSLEVIFTEVGRYHITASYLGDENYNSSQSRDYYFVVNDKLKRDVFIDVPNDIKVGKNVEFAVLGDVTGDLEIYIDGQLQNIENNVVTFKPFNAGLHLLTVTANENSDYHAFNQSIPFVVIKNVADISISLPETIMVGQTISINPVTDSDGSLTVKVNGETIKSSYLIPFKTTFVITVESSETEMFYEGFYSTTFTPV